MPLRSYKATSPGRRFMTRSTFEEITTDTPHKPLLEPQKRGSGRNNQGRLTVRHRGGGEKRHYRRIDFRRDKWGVPAKLATIEYDPNRSARIGLLHYADGEKRYILVPNGLKVGDTVVAGPDAEARVGNALPLSSVPLGTQLHNIELVPGKGGQIVRSAGASAQLLAKEGDSAQVRLPSGEDSTGNTVTSLARSRTLMPLRRTSSGCRGSVICTRLLTSNTALSTSVPTSKVVTRLLWPLDEELELKYSSPSTPESCSSMGAATVRASVSALAPG